MTPFTSILIITFSSFLISYIDGYTDTFISSSSNQFNGQKISCSGNGDCKIICSESYSCFNAQIECPAHFQCDITCSGRNSCHSSFVTCPFGELCSIDCTNSNSCRQMTIDGKYASELHLNDCSSGDLSCNGMTIYFPPNNNGPRGFIHGGNTLASLNNEPLNFYAIFGWHDIAIIDYNGNYQYNSNGLMHCLPHYTSTCQLSTDSWSCLQSDDICNSPPTQQPTTAPTSTPTRNPTNTPTISPSSYPTYSPTLQPSTSIVTVPVFMGYDPSASSTHAAQSGVLWILISILLSILCFIMIILTYYVYISRYKNDEGDIRGMAVNRYRAALSISNLKHQPSHEQSGHNLLPNQNIDESEESDHGQHDINHNDNAMNEVPTAMMHDDDGDDDQVLMDGFGIDTDFGLSDNEEGRFLNETNHGNISNINNNNNGNSKNNGHHKAMNSIQVTENPLARKLQQDDSNQRQLSSHSQQSQLQFVSYSNGSKPGKTLYDHENKDRLAASMAYNLQTHAKPENSVTFHHHDQQNSYSVMSSSPFTYFVKQDGIHYGITQPQSDINIMAYNQQLQNTNTLPPENILYHHLQQLQQHTASPLHLVIDNVPRHRDDDDDDDEEEDHIERKDRDVDDITVSAMSDVEDDGETKPASPDKPESTKNSPTKRRNNADFISVNTNNLITPKETSCKSTKTKLPKKHRFSVTDNNLSVLSPLSTVTASSVTTTKYGGTGTTKYEETPESPPIYHDQESEVQTENVDKQRQLAFGNHPFVASQGYTLTLTEDKNSHNRAPSAFDQSSSSSSSSDNSSSSSSANHHSSSTSCSSTDDLTRITSDDSDGYEDDEELKRSEVDDSCSTSSGDIDASSSSTDDSEDIDEKLKDWNNDLSQDVDKYDSDSLDSFHRKRKTGQSTVSETTQYNDNPMYHKRYTTTLIKDVSGNTPTLKPTNNSTSQFGLMNIKISDDSQLYESPYDDHSRNDSGLISGSNGGNGLGFGMQSKFKYIVSEYDGNKSVSVTPETPIGHTTSGHTASVGTQILKSLLFTVGRGSNTTTSHVKSPVDDQDEDEDDENVNGDDSNNKNDNGDLSGNDMVGVTTMQHGHTNSTLEIQGLINV